MRGFSTTFRSSVAMETVECSKVLSFSISYLVRIPPFWKIIIPSSETTGVLTFFQDLDRRVLVDGFATSKGLEFRRKWIVGASVS